MDHGKNRNAGKPMKPRIGKDFLWLALAVTLPFSALAVEENTVIPLPTSVPVAGFATVGPEARAYSPAQLESYYAGAGLDAEGERSQSPSLMAEERERAAKLLTDYQNGERSTLNVLNAAQNVSVGVYKLSPADFEGESVYVLLPVRPLTDDELLAIIAAYAELGQTFDPNGLSFRNCARGGGIECSRFYVDEERERGTVIRDLYNRQAIACDDTSVPIPHKDGFGIIPVNPDDFSGMDSFSLLPYRSLTDDELLRKVAYQEGETGAVSASEYAEYETQFRAELARVLDAPLSLTRRGEGIYKASDFSLFSDDHAVYQCSLGMVTLDGKRLDISGLLNLDTRKLDIVSRIHHSNQNLVYTDILRDPYDPLWERLAREAVEAGRNDGVGIERIECAGESPLVNNTGTGVDMEVFMADGSYYFLSFAYADEALESMEYQAVTPQVEYPELMNP